MESHGIIRPVTADEMSDGEWGRSAKRSRWVWAARVALVVGMVGSLAGANGGWGIWAGVWFVAGGMSGVIGLRSDAIRSSSVARMIGPELAVVLNGVGAVGFVGLGIFLLIRGFVT
jgi:hypothetical protein